MEVSTGKSRSASELRRKTSRSSNHRGLISCLSGSDIDMMQMSKIPRINSTTIFGTFIDLEEENQENVAPCSGRNQEKVAPKEQVANASFPESKPQPLWLGKRGKF